MLHWLRTARHLPPRQAAAWILRRVRGRKRRALAVDPSPQRRVGLPALGATAAALDDLERSVRPDPDDRQALHVLDHRFRFLNVERRLPVIDWSGQYESPLWTYSLHYFGYAVDLARAWRATGNRRFGDRYIELWTDWLDAAEAGRARLEPYPTSVRCLNALWSMWLIEARLPRAFADRLSSGTHAQLQWLSRNLERHLGANHLQKNLVALAWGSLAFDGRAARSWGRYREELWTELRRQVLPDGGHFERSPMYHALLLDDYLRTLALFRAAGTIVPDDVPSRLAAAARALQWLSRSDGNLHLFNDAANDASPDRNQLLTLARHVLDEDFPEPDGVFALPDTGYYGFLDPGAGRRLVIDAGPLGPSFQPGHAHCDMLSFELDLAGRPVVVDAGVHGYDGDAYREYVRSTRAHNTVAIDGLDQHEMWATFRVARRGEVLSAAGGRASDGEYVFEGTCRHFHDRRAIHRRTIVWRDGGLTVTDAVQGAADRPLTSWVHLHPDFRIERSEGSILAVADGPRPRRVSIDIFGVDRIRILEGERQPVQGWYCPEFGIALAAPAIELRVGSNDERRFGYSLRPCPNG